jgi:hypothetical protein
MGPFCCLLRSNKIYVASLNDKVLTDVMFLYIQRNRKNNENVFGFFIPILVQYISEIVRIFNDFGGKKNILVSNFIKDPKRLFMLSKSNDWKRIKAKILCFRIISLLKSKPQI